MGKVPGAWLRETNNAILESGSLASVVCAWWKYNHIIFTMTEPEAYPSCKAQFILSHFSFSAHFLQFNVGHQCAQQLHIIETSALWILDENRAIERIASTHIVCGGWILNGHMASWSRALVLKAAFLASVVLLILFNFYNFRLESRIKFQTPTSMSMIRPR